jgi:hypothetical protein
MSDPTTSTLWSVTGAEWIDTETDVDSITISLRTGDEDYAVACTGPKGMKSNQFISALRAATASLIRANGGDISTVGAAQSNMFDTGNQRAN